MKIIIFFLGFCLSLAAHNALEMHDINYDVHYYYSNNNLENFLIIRENKYFDLNKPNKAGLNLAHVAARDGNIEWLAVLHWLGADFSCVDLVQHWTPLVWAHAAHQVQAYKLLINYGLSPQRPALRSG